VFLPNAASLWRWAAARYRLRLAKTS
jgi:hypothetical protein